MAVKPTDCTELADTERRILAEQEAQIDAYLSTHYIAGEKCYVSIPSLSQRVLKELKARYNRTGWVVEYHSDQRDGPSLTFGANSEERGDK